MRSRWLLAVALVVSLAATGQETALLRVKVTLVDAAGQPTPVARHALLISDNPASGAPKLVRTAADGTVDVRLASGSYAVESDRAVMFEGKAYEWFQYLDLPAGQEVTLELTKANAATSDPVPAPGSTTSQPDTDPTFLLGQWQNSVVSIWSPTARATGFVVDAGGLIATDRKAVGDATTVAVQFSETLKVSARVLVSDAARDVAVVWVNPATTVDRPPVALDCPPAPPLPVSAGDRILAITSEIGRPTDVTFGEVISPGPPRVAANVRLSRFGGGGPVFSEAGRLVGITTIRGDPESPRWHEVEVIPTVRVCEALSAARSALTGAAPPEATLLPVEPVQPFPVSALEDTNPPAGGAGSPAVVTSDDFEITFVTPPAIYRARRVADRTGGRGTRAPEVEARLGRVTDFGAWSDYFLDPPAVLVVRATPKLVEGFWKRVGREAARTQGAELPPFKNFKTSFVRLTLRCGSTTISPIQPFVLEHTLSKTDSIREGLYVFDPNALDPQCGDMRLDLFSEGAPDEPDTVTIPPAIVEQISNDFAAWRDARR